MARKFDVGRGLMLYEQHEATRIREGLVKFEPTADPLRTELETGKFTVLVIHCYNRVNILTVFAARFVSVQHLCTLTFIAFKKNR